ncbi:MAG TPA: pyruvate dehydrogenase (acetyl-transferring) E1 component subunit alpha, partial [Xanthobacteraceae bacterium]
EPLERLRHYLTRAVLWDKDKEELLLQECGRTIERAAEDYLATPVQPPEAMFDLTYAHTPVDLAEQRAAAAQLLGAS